MILTDWSKDILQSIAIFAIGVALGWFATGFVGEWKSNSSVTPNSSPALVVAETTESTTILQPKPEPTYRLTIRKGAGSDFKGEGKAVSPGVETNSPNVAAQMDFNSGTPAVPTPPGSDPLNKATASTGGLSLKTLGGGGAYILIILGAIVFLCGPAGFVLGKKIGMGLSLTEAGIISLAGVGLIGMGTYPDLAPMLVIGLAGLAAAYGVFYVLKSRKVGKVSARALAAARMVKAIDEADTGDGSAGDVIKKAVSANVGKGTELEKVIDEIIAEAGA